MQFAKGELHSLFILYHFFGFFKILNLGRWFFAANKGKTLPQGEVFACRIIIDQQSNQHYSHSVLSYFPLVKCGGKYAFGGNESLNYQSGLCTKNFFVYPLCTSKSGISLVSMFVGYRKNKVPNKNHKYCSTICLKIQ